MLLAIVLVVLLSLGCVFTALAESEAFPFECEVIEFIETDVTAEAAEAIEDPTLGADIQESFIDGRIEGIEEITKELNIDMLSE